MKMFLLPKERRLLRKLLKSHYEGVLKTYEFHEAYDFKACDTFGVDDEKLKDYKEDLETLCKKMRVEL